jgi:hypothetical protein
MTRAFDLFVQFVDASGQPLAGSLSARRLDGEEFMLDVGGMRTNPASVPIEGLQLFSLPEGPLTFVVRASGETVEYPFSIGPATAERLSIPVIADPAKATREIDLIVLWRPSGLTGQEDEQAFRRAVLEGAKPWVADPVDVEFLDVGGRVVASARFEPVAGTEKTGRRGDLEVVERQWRVRGSGELRKSGSSKPMREFVLTAPTPMFEVIVPAATTTVRARAATGGVATVPIAERARVLVALPK